MLYVSKTFNKRQEAYLICVYFYQEQGKSVIVQFIFLKGIRLERTNQYYANNCKKYSKAIYIYFNVKAICKLGFRPARLIPAKSHSCHHLGNLFREDFAARGRHFSDRGESDRNDGEPLNGERADSGGDQKQRRLQSLDSIFPRRHDVLAPIFGLVQRLKTIALIVVIPAILNPRGHSIWIPFFPISPPCAHCSTPQLPLLEVLAIPTLERESRYLNCVCVARYS